MKKILDIKSIEEEIRKFWEEKNLPRKIVENRLIESKKKFFLLDGPPYVNQIAHVGHIKTTTMKDVWSKFKLMQGFASWFQPGFDCHGLPIENMVEKKLGLKSKKDIEKMGMEKFIQLCREHAEGNEKYWLDLYKKLGAWRGYFNPYLTLENYYIESAWWAIKKFAEKNMLYEGEKPTFWCPRCETALAGYEVTDSYANVKDPYIYIKFPIEGKEKEYIVVFTTTPWTLVGNVAIAVHPDEFYAKVKVNDEILIIAEKRVEVVLKELCKIEDYQILEKIKGKNLEGTKYLPVLDVPIQQELNKNGKAHRIVLSIPVLKSRAYTKTVSKGEEKMEEEVVEFVNVEEGSGSVHTAPGHGPEDYYIGRYYELPIVSPVNEEGKFTKDAGKFEGILVKEANSLIVEELEKNGYLLYNGSIVHSYPLCWRCKTPLIFRLSKQWFLSIEPIKKKMLEENEKVKWLPEFGRERFKKWVENATDWCISRQRYWGIPLPVWRCEKCGEVKVVGSLDELKKLSVSETKEGIDLHKHVVDKIKIRCEKCGGEMKRIPDVLDVWFDSGIAPWASLGYPFKNKNLFEKLWPVDMICESQDQIRGWFYSLMFCGVGVFGTSPYKAVSMMGWVVDEKGEKMSKSKGNVIWADEGIEKYGADIIRLYYCWGKAPWEVQSFSDEAIKEVRKFLNIFWNTFLFFDIFVEDDFKPSLKGLKTEDRWILSRLNSLIEEISEYMENFEFHKAGRKILDFVVEDLSRTYIKLIRDRIEENSAKSTLFYCLLNLTKLLAPITPFLSEKIYQSLKIYEKDEKNHNSVFEAKWPVQDKKFIDKEMEELMILAKKIVETTLDLRQKNKIKLRWPIECVYVDGEKDVKKCVDVLGEIIKKMVNSKRVEFGKKDGKEFDGKEFENGFVSIKKELSEELKDEALVRELIRRIQEERKKNKFNIKDVIVLTIKSNFEKKLSKFKTEIKKHVGAKKINFGELKGEFEGEFEFEGEIVKFKFSKA